MISEMWVETWVWIKPACASKSKQNNFPQTNQAAPVGLENIHPTYTRSLNLAVSLHLFKAAYTGWKPTEVEMVKIMKFINVITFSFVLPLSLLYHWHSWSVCGLSRWSSWTVCGLLSPSWTVCGLLPWVLCSPSAMLDSGLHTVSVTLYIAQGMSIPRNFVIWYVS